jgi:hypothetical protein
LVVVGYAGMFFTGTLFDAAFLYPDGYWETFVQPTYEDGWRMHARAIPRTILAIASQNMLWLGMWNLQEQYFVSTIARELAYILLGVLLLRCTGSYVSSSWVACAHDEWQEIAQARPFNAAFHVQVRARETETDDPCYAFAFTSHVAASLCLTNIRLWYQLQGR